MNDSDTNGQTTAERPIGVEVIREKLRLLPNAPGVYRMIGAKGDVLYVGKARDLKKRVTSYTTSRVYDNRIMRMVSETADMVFVTTASETEALLLEANLIKRLTPRYNVHLRDDKSFPFILVTGDHAFPQILKHRGAHSRTGEYFGPFASAGAVGRTLNTLQRAFLLRSCSDSVFESRTRPCLLFQIKRCAAPCVAKIDEANYAGLVAQAHDFLTGKSQSVKENLSKAMDAAAGDLDFEKAARLRDRIRALSSIQAHQGINPQTIDDADVFAVFEQGGHTCIEVFFFRGGQNWGNRAYFPKHDKSQHAGEVLDAFLAQFYDDKEAPKLILLSETIESSALLAEALTLREGRKVEVSVPRRGEKREIVEAALKNAKEELGRRLADSSAQAKLLDGVAELFGLAAPPRRIEVYDNSHIQGAKPVGGMIVAGPDGFEKSQYRKFNIREAEAGDDFGMMREMLKRRFTRLMKDNPKAVADAEGGPEVAPVFDDSDKDEDARAAWPDLVLIDGGQGQLSAALDIVKELGVEDVVFVGVSKGPDRNAGREQFHMAGREPFMLEPRNPVLYYLQRLRDEAHRFAIGSHRARRAKAIVENPLDGISGIGGARKRALLHHFGSARAVGNASLADLEAVGGISKAMAKKIFDYFRK